MKHQNLKFLTLIACFQLCTGFLFASSGIKLIENKGQWKSNVLYKAFIPGGSYFVENGRLTYSFYDQAALHDAMHNHKKTDSIKFHVIRVNFKDANPQVRFINSDSSFESYNYFIGNDASKWASGAKAYGKITLKDLWKGIDLEIITQGDALKYNFIVNPNGNPKSIKLEYEGASNVYLEKQALNIKTTLGQIIEQKPVAYQTGAMDKAGISCSYILNKNTIGFNVSGYNSHLPLVIDPLVIFATFSGSYADNFGFTGTYNSGGCAISGGTVFSDGFPTTSGAFQEKFKGGMSDIDASGNVLDLGRDAGILKYSPDGKKLLWATYLGGSNNEQPHSMMVNKNDELVIFGTTYSKDFPVTSGAFNKSYSGNGDIFVCKISSGGTKLVASTFIGGSGMDGLNGQYNTNPNGGLDGPLAYNYGDHFRGEVIVDSNNNIFIASCTRSSDFPVRNAIQSSLNGSQDACIIRLKPDLSDIVWSTFLGGKDEDAAYGINIDSKGNIFTTGGTLSNNFPGMNGGFLSSYQGNIDGFLTKISNDGSKILAGTYIGTSNYDQSYLVQIGVQDKVYVTGQTKGQFPVNGLVYKNSNGKQFIGVYSNDLSSLTLSTVFGSGRSCPDISPSAFLVDLCGRICVSGWGGSINSFYNGDDCRTNDLAITDDAFQKNTDGSDFYMIVFGRDLSSLVYATYFGGTAGSWEHVDGGTSRFDYEGKVYQSVCGGCGGFSDFPTTPGAWSRTNNGKRPSPPYQPGLGGCNNAIFKMDLNSSNYPPEMKDTTLVIYGSTDLNYIFDIADKDKKDSIYVNYSGVIFDGKLMKGNAAKMNLHNDIANVHSVLHWSTECNQITTDTYVVNITMHDNGCPTQKSSTGKIKIALLPPPPVKSPGVFCLDRVDPTTLKISWSAYTDAPYLKEYNLVKVFPDGHSAVVKTFNLATDNSFTDYNVPDYRTKDYCYFIYGVNTCGEIGDSTREICSVVSGDSLPSAINIHTVTVINNGQIKINWNQTSRSDYLIYNIYRRENTRDSQEFRLYKVLHGSQKDTLYIDSGVDVQNMSYSYKVQIVTQCGLFSPDGRYGTSILLKGISVPFEHHLSWNPYSQWKTGVAGYDILRKDTGSTFSLNNFMPSKQNSYIDDSLNYDWGLYNYKIVAHEQNGGDNAISESNEIQLIQNPVFYAANVFTPNGDSTNDSWKPTIAFVKEIHLKIFNRWGMLVWETGNKKASWNGSYLGNDPFVNVLIWQSEYTGWDKSTHFKVGNITILK